jgi:hypothetical protein
MPRNYGRARRGHASRAGARGTRAAGARSRARAGVREGAGREGAGRGRDSTATKRGRAAGAGEPSGRARPGARLGAGAQGARGADREATRGRSRGGELTSGSKSGDHRLQNLGHHHMEREGGCCAGEIK